MPVKLQRNPREKKDETKAPNPRPKPEKASDQKNARTKDSGMIVAVGVGADGASSLRMPRQRNGRAGGDWLGHLQAVGRPGGDGVPVQPLRGRRLHETGNGVPEKSAYFSVPCLLRGCSSADE